MRTVEGIHSRRTVIRKGLLAAGGLGLGLPMLSRSSAVLAASREAVAGANTIGAGSLSAANLDFGLRLFGQLTTAAAGSNVFLSPLSVSLALAMAYNGAATTTQQAMARALSVQGMSLPALNQAGAALIAALAQSDKQVQVSIADAIWQRKGLPVIPTFSQRLKTFYGAGSNSLDFSDPSAPNVINGWVRQATHGLIPSIVDKIDPATILYLISALYFKGAWTQPFNPASTRKGSFTLANGQTTQLPMMTQSGDFPYYQDSRFQAIRIPYGAGKMSMLVFLPTQGSNTSALVASLTSKTLNAWLASLKPAQGSITLPRFSVQYATSLKPALTALGMGVAFDAQRADFSAMVHLPGENVFIGEVQHKAVMHVYEAGTTAAAVTSVGMTATAVMAEQFTMVVNRPFLCAIRDDTTGAVLFLGAITNPQSLN